jgi:asparagine synthase (glutamine-hydrolysing)
MCGIVGQIVLDGEINRDRFAKATDTLTHRGPDGGGLYFSENGRIALGHRRLSFLDLSDSGKQPMESADGNVVISFNGEIYNYRELKAELAGEYPFKTDTDTEVLIAAYLNWGIGFLKRIKGMFAFALYDHSENQVYLVRDRFGIKPLYYCAQHSRFTFASELKAILVADGEKKRVNYSAMADFFVYRYIPSPKSIWEGVSKIPPAHYLKINLKNLSFTEHEYWQLNAANNSDSDQSLVSEIDSILSRSVEQHLRSDVPIGSFLSGGYDSSALVYYMKRSGYEPHTFSVGFDNWNASEDTFAKIVSDHFGLQNSALSLSEESLSLVDIMPDVYDEPIADISIVPTYAVSRLARTQVKTVFSGEGADELFAGYGWQHNYYNLLHPKTLKGRLDLFFNPPDTVDFYANSMAMGKFDAAELKQLFHPDLHDQIEPDVHWFYRKHHRPEIGGVKAIQYLDMKCFMGELVLTKVDRASMANSLEVRVPFLDHELFETVFSKRESAYIKPNQTKHLLYENIKAVMPPKILARGKQGFVGPDSYYMNMAWYKKQLADSSLVKHGIINKQYIDNLLKQDYTWKLWKLLIMEIWFKKWGSPP